MSERSPWTFLSNHGHVLMCLAADPDARLRDIADRVGITERTVFGIVEGLKEAGIVTREKLGREEHLPDRPNGAPAPSDRIERRSAIYRNR